MKPNLLHTKNIHVQHPFAGRIFGADKIWPNQPFAVHLVIVGFGLGSIIASVVSEPFLEELPHNITTAPEDSQECRNQAVRVQYLYLLLASYGVPVSVGMFVLYMYARQTDPLYSTLFEASSTGANNRRGYSLFLVFFLLLCMPAGGVFVTYGDLLTTFGVNSNLHIRQRYMALITALFWGALVTGRIVMTIASIFIRQMWIIIVCGIGLFSASISLVFFANESQWSLAILSAVFGFFCAPTSAACFSLARERIQLTGFVVAVGNVGENVGSILGPYVGGLLMGTYSSDAFLYVVLSYVTILFILFCCIYTIGRYFLESNSREGVHLLHATSSQSEDEATDSSDTV